MTTARRKPPAAAVALLALFTVLTLALATACSSSSKRGTSPSSGAVASSSTKDNPAPYAAPGPYAVGVTTLQLAGGRKVVVWYPADKGSTAGHAREQIDIASNLSPALQAKIPPKDRVLYPTDAFTDAPASTSGGPFPLALFSHGFAGFPEQSVTITTHLVSWGFVVAAPDHVERSLDGLLGDGAKGVPKLSDVQVLQDTLRLVEDQSGKPGVLHGLVDPNRVVVTGHSAGAGAAYQLAAVDPRVKAWISYSVAPGKDEGAGPTVPDKPGMVMLGEKDGIIPPAQTEQVYATMKAPKWLVKVPGAGHLVFSDICLIGKGQGGIVGLARQLNLGIPENLLKLGSDGCGPNYTPVTEDFPAIDQLSVAFLRWALKIDPEPVGLTTRAVAGLGGNLTVEHQG
jgi:predicted dienelactone hydrolase